MSNRCHIEFEAPCDTSPTTCTYEGSMADNEEDVSFCFDGPRGLIDRAMSGDKASINELMGRIYMGTEASGQEMMDFHWDKGSFHGPSGFSDLNPSVSIDEATTIVFAENDRQRMEKATDQPDPSAKAAPRI